MFIACSQDFGKKKQYDFPFLVYAIEASEMAVQARKVIAANKMEDRIEVIHSMVEVIILARSTWTFIQYRAQLEVKSIHPGLKIDKGSQCMIRCAYSFFW